jgi:IPT/TIG domain
LSAAVAVLVYMVFRAGLGAPDLGLAAADCLEVAGFAGLVGLFAEPATVKLKDVFEAIFTPRRDPREDKAGQASAPSLPEISGLDKKEIKVGQATQLKITGKNFGEAAVVQIGSKPFTARRISATELQVDIPANSLTVGQQPVVVFNKPPSGEASKADSINVTA